MTKQLVVSQQRSRVHLGAVKGTKSMALELYMVGVMAQDMDKSLEFYRRLGLAIPPGSDRQPHVEVKMGGELTFFLDARATGRIAQFRYRP
jgi:hypothetical protein